uniref:Uncharacterized protein n=1 Tax=Scylla olivacea TaxID=85551 RepID=A0A0P4VSD9_SCYOL
MVYGGAYSSSPADTGGGYFLHIMGFGKGVGNGDSMDKMTPKRILTPFTPPLKLLDLSSSWYQDLTGKNSHWGGRQQVSSPRYVTRRSVAHKVFLPDRNGGRKTPAIGSPRLRVAGARQPLHSPQLRKASERESPWAPPLSPLVHLKSGVDSPRLSGRVQKTSRRPKKSVHWKTNIATWIQMNAKPSNVSFSETTTHDDAWEVNDRRSNEGSTDTSDDDGTMRFNTAGKSVCCGASTGKEDDSSDFEYTNFSQINGEGKKFYFGGVHSKDASRSGTLEAMGVSRFPTLKKPPPPPSPPGHNSSFEDNESHHYSELQCSCSSSMHTYEDVSDSGEQSSTECEYRQRCCSESSLSSIHTYCEIEEVNRGSKPEVLASLLRNDRHLDVLKSTLVHLLPKDDIISTTLLACRLGDLEYLQDLDKQGHLDAGAHDLQGASCLHYAARGGHNHVLRFLLENSRQRGPVRCNVGATPLHDAAALGHLDTLKYLIKHASDALTLTDQDGATVLHVAAR